MVAPVTGEISIHALVKRATRAVIIALVGRDISIHALVKRATKWDCLRLRKARYFNPRPREEGDGNLKILVILIYDFNPRPREEGDTIIAIPTILHRNFNPRPREEGDFTVKKIRSIS